MVKENKSRQYQKMFLERCGNVKVVNYCYKKRLTVVVLTSDDKGFAKCVGKDTWNFEIGFYVAYCKALNNKYRRAYKKVAAYFEKEKAQILRPEGISELFRKHIEKATEDVISHTPNWDYVKVKINEND